MLRRILKTQFDRIVYSSPPINKVLRNINKALSGFTSFRLRPYGVLKVRYKAISFKMSTNETSYVTKQLFWNGPEKFEYTPIFEKLVRKCSGFIDIGANTGYYSLLAAKAHSSIIVHAFEPASGPFRFLKKNIDINNLGDRVFCHELALSNKKGQVEFFEIINPADTFARYNLSGVGGLKKTHETQEQSIRKTVEAHTLDEYGITLQLKSYDLIKIDTEGTENLVLEGCRDIIEEYKPIIICETLFNKIEPELEKIMTAHGYLFFNHVRGTLHRTETLIRSTDNGVSDCFFVHPEKISLIEEFVR